MKRTPAADTQSAISILAVVTSQHSLEVERILSHTHWKLQLVHSVREAVQAVRSLPISVLLCQDRLTDGTWLDIVRETEQLCPRPQTIVISGSADSALWGEVLNRGAYDLLSTPLQAREVYAVVPMAWRHSNSRANSRTESKQELACLR